MTISGVQAHLNKTASDALSATFGAPATEATAFGAAVITAQLR